MLDIERKVKMVRCKIQSREALTAFPCEYNSEITVLPKKHIGFSKSGQIFYGLQLLEVF